MASWNLAYLGAQKQTTDKAGNEERMAFLYRSPKIKLLEICCEFAIPVCEHEDIKLPGIVTEFTGFDRNPMITALSANDFRFVLVNVRLFFGLQKSNAEIQSSMNRRRLGAYAVSMWCELRRKDVHRYVDNFIALGDFNLPK